MLEFVHPRTIDAAPGFGPGDDQGDPDVPWLPSAVLSDSERAQLLALFRMFEPTLDEAAMLALRYPTLPEPMRAMAECPIEWWDVVESGVLRYRLWLYAADGGWLFQADTTERVPEGYIAAFAFYGEGWEGDAPGSLAEQLHEAQARSRAHHPSSELSKMAFVAR